jgi:hypothetical protein
MTTGIFEALRVAKEYGLNREEKMSMMRSNDIKMNQEDADKFVFAISKAILVSAINKLGEKEK